MNTLLIMALGLVLAMPQQQVATPEDFTVISNSVENGTRTIIATPSPLVCSKKMTITIEDKTQKILSFKALGGCPGNLQAVDALVRGLTVKEAVSKLDGIQCGRRGTSCTDQLARILKSCYGL